MIRSWQRSELAPEHSYGRCSQRRPVKLSGRKSGRLNSDVSRVDTATVLRACVICYCAHPPTIEPNVKLVYGVI